MPSLAVFADRIHAAIESGVIEVMWEDVEEGEVAVTAGELAVLLAVLLPEEYPTTVKTPAPTTAPPGTARKVEELRHRMEAGLGLWSDQDADMKNATGTLSKGRGKKGRGVILINE